MLTWLMLVSVPVESTRKTVGIYQRWSQQNYLEEQMWNRREAGVTDDFMVLA